MHRSSDSSSLAAPHIPRRSEALLGCRTDSLGTAWSSSASNRRIRMIPSGLQGSTPALHSVRGPNPSELRMPLSDAIRASPAVSTPSSAQALECAKNEARCRTSSTNRASAESSGRNRGYSIERRVGVRGFDPTTPASRRQWGISKQLIFNTHLEMPVDVNARPGMTELDGFRQHPGNLRAG